jgi:hypothetical protein
MSLADALLSAQRGQSFARQIGEYNLRSLGSGGVEVWRAGVAYQPRLPVAGHDENVLANRIRAVFAADPRLSPLDIHVDASANGVVMLRGPIPSADLAQVAIKQALNVSGVNAVDSFMTFNR